MKFKVGDYSDIQEVEVTYLNNYNGWEVLDMYVDTRESMQSSYVNGQSIPYPRHVALIGKRSEGEVPVLLEKIQDLHNKVSALSSESNKFNKELEASKKDSARMLGIKQDEIDNLARQLKASQDLVTPLRDKGRKMEADLSALERAIGTIEFNKIVGGPVKS